jgi:hypothetical protein
MPFVVSADEARRVVIVTVTGEVDAALTKAMVTEARALANPKGFNLLYDLRGATPRNIEKPDVFWFARSLGPQPGQAAWRLRIAALHMPTQRDFMHFWETAFNNVGLAAKAFEDEAEAFAWLAEGGA